jgi:hypothetical protein
MRRPQQVRPWCRKVAEMIDELAEVAELHETPNLLLRRSLVGTGHSATASALFVKTKILPYDKV